MRGHAQYTLTYLTVLGIPKAARANFDSCSVKKNLSMTEYCGGQGMWEFYAWIRDLILLENHFSWKSKLDVIQQEWLHQRDFWEPKVGVLGSKSAKISIGQCQRKYHQVRIILSSAFIMDPHDRSRLL